METLNDHKIPNPHNSTKFKIMKRIVLFSLALLLFTMCRTSKEMVNNDTQTPEETIIDKTKAIKNDKIDLALEYAKERIKQYDYKKAADTLDVLYKDGCYNNTLIKQLESVNFVMGDYVKCIFLIGELETEKELSYQMKVHKGIVFRKLGDTPNAIISFNIALREDSTNVFVLEQLGDMRKKIDDKKGAAELYLLALKNGAAPSVLNKYLGYLISQKKGEEALQAIYDYAPSPMKSYKKLRFNYAMILFSLERFEDAYDQFTSLIKDRDKNPMIHYYAGLSKFEQKKYKEAVPCFEKFLSKTEKIDNYVPYRVMGSCFLKVENLDKALEMFNKAQEIIYPKEQEILSVYTNLADIYSKKGDNSKALQAYVNIEKFYPNNNINLFQTAVFHQSKTKNFKKAAAYYKKLQKSMTPDDTVNNQLNKFFYETSETELKKLEKYLFWTK